MSYSIRTEVDPLLPNDKGAPEILGSRPQSINDGGNEEQGLEDNLRHNVRSNIMPIIFGICFFASISLVLFPDGFLGRLLGDRRPVPKTLEQRVNRILEDTPLIGAFVATDIKALL